MFSKELFGAGLQKAYVQILDRGVKSNPLDEREFIRL